LKDNKETLLKTFSLNRLFFRKTLTKAVSFLAKSLCQTPWFVIVCTTTRVNDVNNGRRPLSKYENK